MGIAAALIVVVVATFSWWPFAARRPVFPRTHQLDAPGSGAVLRPSSARSIAVLPLASVGHDTTNSFFADGITNALISALGQVHGLRVTPRASAFALQGTKLSTRAVGETLHVSTVLEGSVQTAGDRLRVAVELTDPGHDSTLWSGTFDGSRAKVFEIQDSIAKSVVGALQISLELAGAKVFAARKTTDLDAYTVYLRARYIQQHFYDYTDSLVKTLTLFREAIARDPHFALPYAGMADTYVILADDFWPLSDAGPKAKEAAAKAIELDPSLADAHVALGMALMGEWDLTSAERELRTGLSLNPGSSAAHYWYAILLLGRSRASDAVREGLEARELDPLSFPFALNVPYLLASAGRYDDAVTEAYRFLNANPTRNTARAGAAYWAALAGRADESRAVYVPYPSCGTNPLNCMLMGSMLARRGEPKAARADLDRLLALASHQYVPEYTIAALYGALGDRDHAFAWLERAFQVRSFQLLLLRVAPEWEPIRGDPRFAALVQRVASQTR
jgi:TolB-like protein/Tfp pilus assembly protein PilF